jgi:hypothetical protein
MVPSIVAAVLAAVAVVVVLLVQSEPDQLEAGLTRPTQPVASAIALLDDMPRAAGAGTTDDTAPAPGPSATGGSRKGPPAGAGTTGGAATTVASAAPTLPAPASAAPVETATPTPAAPATFDHAAASAAVGRQARAATSACRGQPGPRSVGVAITFRNDGSVGAVRASSKGKAGEASVFCVQRHFWSIQVPPYSGAQQTVNTMVNL